MKNYETIIKIKLKLKLKNVSSLAQNVCDEASLYLYYYLRGFSCLDSSFFQFKNAPTSQYLSRDKTKGQSGKNTTLTPTKTVPKKQGHAFVNFQITLSTYKLDFQNKNYIYKIKIQCFSFTTK